MDVQPTKPKRGFVAAVIGTILVALCCFTPVLVIVLSAIGLSTLTPYLDYVLLPAFVVMVIITIVAYRKWKQTSVT